jgi:hypothetical protein
MATGMLSAAVKPAEAQQPGVRLSIQDGRVTLNAQNVPVRAILAEWSRIGGTKVINADQIAGTPVSLDLKGLHEREVLDILLRNVSGYLLGARVSPSGGASAYDRILILASSNAPRGAAQPVAAAPRFSPRTPRIATGPDTEPAADGDPGDGAATEAQGGPPQPPRYPPENSGAPPTFAQPSQGTPPGVFTPVEPGNPFGVPNGSSGRPGVVTPVPQPNQQPQRRIEVPN